MYENIRIHYWWQWQVEMSHKLMSVLVPRPENDPVSHYWKHSKSFNWRNIWKWLWAPSRHSLSLCIFSSTVMSCVCDSVTEAEPWQLNPATKSLSLATSLPICRCRGSQQSYFLLLFCAKLFYVRSGLQVITSFLVSKHVLYIILLCSPTQLHSWTYSAIYWHLQTFSSQDVAAYWIMKQIICRKIIRDSTDRFLWDKIKNTRIIKTLFSCQLYLTTYHTFNKYRQ